jgi:hypothetical protein
MKKAIKEELTLKAKEKGLTLNQYLVQNRICTRCGEKLVKDGFKSRFLKTHYHMCQSCSDKRRELNAKYHYLNGLRRPIKHRKDWHDYYPRKDWYRSLPENVKRIVKEEKRMKAALRYQSRKDEGYCTRCGRPASG